MSAATADRIRAVLLALDSLLPDVSLDGYALLAEEGENRILPVRVAHLELMGKDSTPGPDGQPSPWPGIMAQLAEETKHPIRGRIAVGVVLHDPTHLAEVIWTPTWWSPGAPHVHSN